MMQSKHLSYEKGGEKMTVESKEEMMRNLTEKQLRAFYDKHYFRAGLRGPLYPKMLTMPQWLGIVWTKVADLPKPRAGLGAAAFHVPGITGPVIYAIGGYTNVDPSNQVVDIYATRLTERYSRQTGIWEEMAPMNLPREDLAAVAAGGKIYAVGGRDTTTLKILGTVEEYDPAANRWTPKKIIMPYPVFLFGAAATSDGKIWVIGGTDSTFATVGRVQCYDTLTGDWETGKKITPPGAGLSVWRSMRTPRSDLAVVAASNGKIYAIGGFNQLGSLSTVEEFDPATNEWTKKMDMLTPRYGLAAVAASNGKIYAMGGTHSGAVLNIVEEYDPKADTWQAINPMNTTRYAFGAAATDDGKIYAIGGATYSPYFSLLSSVEVMTVP
jgi:hypothetical protein